MKAFIKGGAAVALTAAFALAACNAGRDTHLTPVGLDEGQTVQGGQGTSCGYYCYQQNYDCGWSGRCPDQDPGEPNLLCPVVAGWARGAPGGGLDLLYAAASCKICGGQANCGIVGSAPTNTYIVCAP